MPDLEMRTLPATFEIRDDSGTPTLDGYAATFNEDYDLGPFVERITPDAFNRSLGTKPDVRLLIDHEGQPLARTKSGTLTLIPEERGLRAIAQLDPTDPDVQRLMPKMRRGDLDQMSFAFRVPAGGDGWDHTGDKSVRTLRQVELHGGDVSVVTYPANPNTAVALRSGVTTCEANAIFVEAMAHEVRAGKTISAANMTRLETVLRSLATADDALDAAEAAVAEILGVDNPDAADDAAEQNARPLDLSRRIATALSL